MSGIEIHSFAILAIHLDRGYLDRRIPTSMIFWLGKERAVEIESNRLVKQISDIIYILASEDHYIEEEEWRKFVVNLNQYARLNR